MAQNPKLRGLEGNMMAQPRVFAHDAAAVTKSDTTDIPNTEYRGCCLYVGGQGNIKVTMESGEEVTFTGVAAGSFLPILVTRVWSTDTTATDILALY
tara:strand:- start:200 stop:490 length:291 start_codon:yes stop_codon:yes gene_type:complete